MSTHRHPFATGSISITELMPSHPQTKAFGFKVPHYFAWVDNPGSLLSNDGLNRAIAFADDPQAKEELSNVVEWA